MSSATPAAPVLATATVYRWGRVALMGLLGLATAFLFGMVWLAPEYVAIVPVVFIAPFLVGYLFGRPFLNLCVVLGAFALVSGFSDGLQVTEILYGLYYLGFLVHWFITRLLSSEPVLDTVEAKVLVLFLVGVTLSFGLTVLLGHPMGLAFSQWLALLFLGLFFPVREALLKDDRAPYALLGLLCWLGVFMTVRNLFEYRAALNDAEQAWQIVRGRVITNDNILMVVSLVSLTITVFVNRWWHRLAMGALFLIVLGGLILTLSRAYWVVFLIGSFALLVLIRPVYRIRLLVLGIGGLSAALLVGVVFFAEYSALILGGLVDRFASLGTATSRDISLLNRFLETDAIMDLVWKNPILGYGLGAEYRFWDITFMATMERSFIHNGYVSLWYRFGLWGLGLMLTYWVLSGWRGVQAYRLEGPTALRLCGLVTTIALIAFILANITSNQHHLKDGALIFGVLGGMASGAYARLRGPAPASDAA
ncbi:MAG: O-antigen ligase family protein [Bacteroidota bacterium]